MLGAIPISVIFVVMETTLIITHPVPDYQTRVKVEPCVDKCQQEQRIQREKNRTVVVRKKI